MKLIPTANLEDLLMRESEMVSPWEVQVCSFLHEGEPKIHEVYVSGEDIASAIFGDISSPDGSMDSAVRYAEFIVESRKWLKPIIEENLMLRSLLLERKNEPEVDSDETKLYTHHGGSGS